MATTRTETITVGGPDSAGSFSAHLTLPERGSGPGVLLFQEIFGVNEFLKSKAADLAAAGYVVLCPDVFWRVQPNVELPHDEAALNTAFGVMTRYAEEVPHDQKVADLVAALDHLRALPEVDTGAGVATMGYCLGGWLAFETAGQAPDRVDACVSYYGSAVAGRLDDLADKVTCPILFHYGAADPFIPQDHVDAVRSAFAARGDVEIHIYDGAGHAFENFLAPQFSNPAAAEKSWPRTIEFLGRHLRHD